MEHVVNKLYVLKKNHTHTQTRAYICYSRQRVFNRGQRGGSCEELDIRSCIFCPLNLHQ